MSVYDLARQLGEEMVKTAKFERVEQAKAAYGADEEAVALISAYNALRQKYQEDMQKPDLTKEEYSKINQDITDKNEIIKNNPITAELINAENDFNQLFSSVINIVTSTITGEAPESGCSGGCSSCSGCH